MVAEAVGFSTDWVGRGAVAVAGFGVVVVALGCVEDTVAGDGTDFALTTGDPVEGAWLATWVVTGVVTGVVRVVVEAGLVTTAGFCATVLARVWLLCDSPADGCHAGSSVASLGRSGRPTEGLATPPTTITAPTDFGPSNN